MALCAAMHWLQRAIGVRLKREFDREVAGCVAVVAAIAVLAADAAKDIAALGVSAPRPAVCGEDTLLMQSDFNAGSQPALNPCGAVLCIWCDGRAGPMLFGATLNPKS